ncbi:hypothetical protein BC835DRAFT_1396939 [Cytidiella melzeri]|nr:hypothetical protein BC835DRAFT_1396939 [Cytidiella melzeri]
MPRPIVLTQPSTWQHPTGQRFPSINHAGASTQYRDRPSQQTDRTRLSMWQRLTGQGSHPINHAEASTQYRDRPSQQTDRTRLSMWQRLTGQGSRPINHAGPSTQDQYRGHWSRPIGDFPSLHVVHRHDLTKFLQDYTVLGMSQRAVRQRVPPEYRDTVLRLFNLQRLPQNDRIGLDEQRRIASHVRLVLDALSIRNLRDEYEFAENRHGAFAMNL